MHICFIIYIWKKYGYLGMRTEEGKKGDKGGKMIQTAHTCNDSMCGKFYLCL